MRQLTLLLLAGAIAATPAAAQTATDPGGTDPSGIAGADANLATEATDAATVNGLAADPAPTSPAAPPMIEGPGVTDATVTPETGESGGGFPWGVLGLLGLVGLIGRFRS